MTSRIVSGRLVTASAIIPYTVHGGWQARLVWWVRDPDYGWDQNWDYTDDMAVYPVRAECELSIQKMTEEPEKPKSDLDFEITKK